MTYIETVKNNLDNTELKKWLNSGRFRRYAENIDAMPERVAKQLLDRVPELLWTPEEEAYYKCKDILRKIKYYKRLDSEWGETMSVQDVADAAMYGNDYSFTKEIKKLKAEFESLRPLANKWLPI